MRAIILGSAQLAAVGLAFMLACDASNGTSSTGGAGGSSGGSTGGSTGGSVSGAGGSAGALGGQAGALGGQAGALGGQAGALGGQAGAPGPITCGTTDLAYEVAAYANVGDFTVNAETQANDQHTLTMSRGDITRQVSMYTTAGAAKHRHAVRFSLDDLNKLAKGETVTVMTEGSPLEGSSTHGHTITVQSCLPKQ